MASGVGGSIAIILLVFSILVFSVLWITIVLIKSIIRGIRGQARHSKTADQLERQTFPHTNQTPADPAQYDYDLVPFEPDDGQGHGYVVQRLEDGQRLTWGSLTNHRQCMESLVVAGEDYRYKDLQADSFRPPARLMLVPEPENQYDPHAVAVWDSARRHQAGYIPRDETQRIGKQLMEGHVVECVSMWETIADGQRVSLRLLLLYQNARLRMPTEARPQSVDQTWVCSRCQTVLPIRDCYCWQCARLKLLQS